MSKWGKVDPKDDNFFKELDGLEETLEADPGYGVQEEMLDSVGRINANADELVAGKDGLTKEQVAWNSMKAPESAYNGKGVLETYPTSENTIDNYDKALNNTSNFQPFADQTTQELEILKGLNVNMAKQMELDLKYKVEFYNSYVTSIGSMEDNTSKQRRAPIDRLKS